MNPEHEKAMKEASAAELVIARFRLTSRRNLAIFAGVVSLAIIIWLRWSLWLHVLPVLMWFAAAGQHFHLKLIDHELASRKSAEENQKL